MNYLKTHQADLRAEHYQGLQDAVHQLDFEAGVTAVGKRIVLPSSYAGSPRAMHQNYLDAMTIVRKFGKPDFFITMTANPPWPEIVDNLRGQETAHSRPDLVARVFRIKFKALLDDLLGYWRSIQSTKT